MPGTYSQILLHIVFSTSRREPWIAPDLGAFLHLRGYLTQLRRQAPMRSTTSPTLWNSIT